MGRELKDFTLHTLLKRQLKRTSLNADAVPQDKEAWVDFLIRVNQAYIENDQDRYTLERSLEISSKELNVELITAARRAGMSDIAVNILHNIGNTLNSVNVTAELLRKRITNSKLSNLSKASALLKQILFETKENSELLEKSKQIINYLDQLSLYWEDEKEHFLKEMITLDSYILQINNVVKMQQAISGSIGHVEPVNLHEAMNDALSVGLENIQKHNIYVVKQFSPLSKVLLDKIKLLQILMNLINNALDALSDSKSKKRRLTLKIGLQDPNTCYIEVADNGIGIKKEDLNKIFSYGFTTKKKGHGFGLHSSALLAKELGGNLSVASQGADTEAVFTLRLPYNPAD